MSKSKGPGVESIAVGVLFFDRDEAQLTNAFFKVFFYEIKIFVSDYVAKD